MRNLTLLIFIAIGMQAIGCQTRAIREVKLHSHFDEEYFVEKLKPIGNNTIKGSALLRQQGGGVQTCAGYDVSMVPVDRYSSERMGAIYGSLNKGFISVWSQPIKFLPENDGYQKSVRTAMCNAQGFFSFDKVQDGEYFVISSIQWQIPGPYGTSRPEGGNLFSKIRVQGGETIEIVLSQ